MSKRDYIMMETRAMFPYLIEIVHYDVNGEKTDSKGNKYNEYYFANTDEDIVHNEKTYKASWFTFQLPEIHIDSVSSAKFSFSAIDQEWITRIIESEKRLKVKFVAVMSVDSDSGAIVLDEIEEEDFELSNVEWNESVINGTLEYDTKSNVRVPIDVITKYNTPALG